MNTLLHIPKLKLVNSLLTALPKPDVLGTVFIFHTISRNSHFIFTILMILVFGGNAKAQGTQTFVASGTFTVPAGVTSINIECWGSGAAGSSNAGAAGGGGGGAYTAGTISGLTPLSTIAITVGTGGTIPGSNGNPSIVGGITANGGFSTTNKSGGAGGAASAIVLPVTASYSGGNGGDAGPDNNGANNEGGGGGGGSAFNTAAGTNGGNATSTWGVGGTGTGSGGNGADGDGNPDAIAGTAPGGGGGGRGEGGGVSNAGAAGRVIITWICPANAGTISGIQNVCVGSTTTFNSTLTGGTWTSGTPAIATINAATGVITGVTAGTATITYTLSPAGCPVRTATRSVTVDPLPTANAGPAMSDICQGGTSALLGGSIGGTATGGIWSSSAGGTFNPSATTLNATWTPPAGFSGTATLTLTTTGGSCGTSSASKTITVITAPTANAGSALPDICQRGISAPLGGSIGGGATGGIWSDGGIGGTFTPNATTLNSTWTPPAVYFGTAILTLTTTGPVCAPVAASKNIIVKATPTVTAPANQTYCNGVATAAIPLSGTPSGVVFDIAGGALVGLANITGVSAVPSFIPTTGTATVSITPRANGCTGTAVTYTIRVNTFPSITSQPVNQGVCTNASATFSVTATGTPVLTYQWRKNGITLPGATSSSLTISPVTATELGNYDVVITNSCGSITSSVAILSFSDNQPPIIAGCPANISNGTNPGTCNALVNWTEPTATDNCDLPALLVWTKSHTPPFAFPIGTTVVVYTVRDLLGNVSLPCTFTVTVTDNINPVITCPVSSPQNVITNSGCAYLHSGTGWNATATDNCTVTGLGYSLSGATSGSGTTLNNVSFNVGTTTVTWTTQDASGNTAACSFTVVVVEGVSPVITCPVSGIQNVFTNSGCMYVHSGTAWNATATDNCTVPVLSYSLSGVTTGTGATLNNVAFNLGTTTVTWTAKDAAGNFSVCSFQVLVADDDNPVITCPIPAASYNTDLNQCYASLSFAATAIDNCGIQSIKYYIGASEITFPYNFPKGITTVTAIATDNYGLTAQCNFNVNVVDNQPPVITCKPGPHNRNAIPMGCYYIVSGSEFDPESYSDNCAGSITISNSYNSLPSLNGATFLVGNTTIAWTVTAANGQTAVCIITIKVSDAQAPVINNCPVNISVNTGPGRLTCDQVATWAEPTATDNCTAAGSLVWTKSHPPGSTFPVGVTTVTYVVRDQSNNQATCTFTVTVTDNTPPTFTPPGPITVYTDASCNASILPAITGNPGGLFDNCTLPGNLTVTYVDGPNIPGPCPGTYSFTRTWTVSDAVGNTSTGIQIISVTDNVIPNITVPASMSVQCDQATQPPATGTATATDNCTSPVNIAISFTDAITPGSGCASNYTITRTWRATDCTGNFATANQLILVTDVTKPVASVSNITVACPADIPAPGPSAVTASDNCGPVTIVLFNEVAYGLAGMPGYCPTSVERVYRVTDLCGNYTDVTQTITVTAPCGCSPCTPGTEFHLVDMLGNPTASISVTSNRTGLCCDATNPMRCIAFNVRLDPDAVGVEILIDGASPDFKEWKIDCNTISILGNIVCIPGGVFHLFTFCKQGNNSNTFTFRSINGVVGPGELNTRVDCSGQLTVTGIVSNPVWNSVFPGVPGAYNSYLSSTTVLNPIFTAPVGSPPVIKYVVCGTIANTVCTATGVDCDTVTVYVTPKIEISFDIDPQQLCIGVPMTITPVITPAANYTFEWFTGYNALGIPFSNATSFTPTVAGPYSLKVTDIQGGIPCSWDTINFDVAFDILGPLVLAPPGGDLNIECNSSTAAVQISNWLASASASYILPDGNVVTLVPTNNFTSINMVCGTVLSVTFSAKDQCDNISYASANINVLDTRIPTWLTSAGSLNRTVSCSDATALANAQLLVPQATDLCDNTLAINKTSGQFVPGTCPQVGTYTNTWVAVDDCNNTSATSFIQVISVSDVTAPVINPQASDITVECDGSGNIADLNNWLNTYGGAIATDECGAVTWTNNFTALSDLCGGTGSATVIFTAGDGCGNYSSTSAVFTISDTQQPSLTCPPDVISQVDPINCTSTTVVLGTPTYSEICSLPVALSNNAPSSFPAGITIVTWTATDACGNTSTCTQKVTVVDNVPPTVDCPLPVTVFADPGVCTAFVTVPPPVVTDPCPYTMINSFNNTSNANGTYPVGITVVTWTITGISGNVTTCVQNVTVIDNQPPTISCPGNMLFTAPPPNCVLVVSIIPPPVLNDNCGSGALTLSWSLSGATVQSGTGSVNGTTFNAGITTVTYVVTDGAGNQATCQFTVTVNDQVPPTFINCPADITVIAPIGICSANITVPLPDVTDPCGEIVSITNSFNGTGNASGTYPVGITIVTWTITDASGNATTCIQSITVTDIQAPVFTYCPPDMEDLITNGGCSLINVIVPAPLFTDNCPNLTLTWTMSGATTSSSPATGIHYVSGQTFNVGVTTVTYTLSDANGNTTTCTFTVWIKNLNAPQFSVTCPVNVTVPATSGRCDANVNVPSPGISNPCNEAFSVVNNSPYQTSLTNASGIYPGGVTTFSWTVTDASGNVTICTQTVTVTDAQAPVFTYCPPNMEDIITNGGCSLINVIVPAPLFTDNCPDLTLSWAMSGATTNSSPATGINYVSGQTFNVGVTTVTYTLSDANGNTTTCTFTVWIKNLNAPQFSVTCPGNITVPADPGQCHADVVVSPPGIDNPCNEAFTVVNNSPYGDGLGSANGTYPIGTTTVTWLITDASGNINTCIQLVTVSDIPSVLICPSSIIVNADFEKPFASGVNIGVPIFSDNCGNLTLTWVASAPTPGTSPGTGINIDTVSIYNVGVTTITYSLTDSSGVVINCSFTVTVLAKPVIDCPIDITANNDPGLCSAALIPGQPNLISGVQPITWTWTMTGATVASGTGAPITPNPFTFNVGVTTIRWIATNVSGSDTCTHTVTVIDNEPPTFVLPANGSYCVNNLITGIYNPSPTPGIIPEYDDITVPRPEYYLLSGGSVVFDLDPVLNNFNDNCCADNELIIHWRISFSPTPNPATALHEPITQTAIPPQTGQPSAYGDIMFPGDGVNFANIDHYIYYWLEDCHGILSPEQMLTVTIAPRPNIIKQ